MTSWDCPFVETFVNRLCQVCCLQVKKNKVSEEKLHFFNVVFLALHKFWGGVGVLDQYLGIVELTLTLFKTTNS